MGSPDVKCYNLTFFPWRDSRQRSWLNELNKNYNKQHVFGSYDVGGSSNKAQIYMNDTSWPLCTDVHLKNFSRSVMKEKITSDLCFCTSPYSSSCFWAHYSVKYCHHVGIKYFSHHNMIPTQSHKNDTRAKLHFSCISLIYQFFIFTTNTLSSFSLWYSLKYFYT